MRTTVGTWWRWVPKRGLVILILLLLIGVGIYQTHKPLPAGTSTAWPIETVADKNVEFLGDLTYHGTNGERVVNQEIFDHVFKLVDEAKRFVLIDAFLFNTDFGNEPDQIKLTNQLTDALIAKKESNPDMPIVFITDEINNFYGAYTSPEIKRLRAAGVEVVVTDLTKLRDSNPVYSALWRTAFSWWGTSGTGWLPQPLGCKDSKVTLRSYLKLLNTKANHRKVFVADSGDGIATVVTSANPHNASSLHSNVALLIHDTNFGRDVISSESAVAKFSGHPLVIDTSNLVEDTSADGAKNVTVQFLTEGAIKEALLRDLNATKPGDKVMIAMFYLSDRDVIKAIRAAAARGVAVRLVLDPNKDAFGRQKNGIPNRETAFELTAESGGKIPVRWYDTQGEQFHTKMTIIDTPNQDILLLGSANYTRRNLGDLNLESIVRVTGNEFSAFQAARDYFKRIWNNSEGEYTLDFMSYRDPSQFKYWLYRLQEWSGFSSF